MEEAYVFINEVYDVYSNVFIFYPEVCKKTDSTIEVIDFVKYNKFFENKAILRDFKIEFSKINLAIIPEELYEKYKVYFFSNEDKSNEMSDIIAEVIESAEVMNSLSGVNLKIIDRTFVNLKDEDQRTKENIEEFIKMLNNLDDSLEAVSRMILLLRMSREEVMSTKSWTRFFQKYGRFMTENFEKSKVNSSILKKQYDLI